MKSGFGFADYLLYLDRKAVGAVEAKAEGTLSGVEAQSAKYAAGLPDKSAGSQTVARVLKCLLNLALQYGEVRPSLDGIARLACVCKQTVVNCLKLLEFYGFVMVHRRIKKIRTALGFKVVQDTNAYTIQEPRGLGALAARTFKQGSESKKRSASSTEIHSIKRSGRGSQPWGVPDGVYGSLYAQWEAT